jgi:acyl-coenzyme A thioesterase PaaI-like protein
MRFIRAMNAATGRVIATGTVVHTGRRHAIAEGRIEVEATGKLIATGTADCPILRPS